jgi:hypothetical protein
MASWNVKGRMVALTKDPTHEVISMTDTPNLP